MTERYFEKFGTIEYSNNTVVDITKRVALLDGLSNPFTFYPYELSDNERADQFANRYYEDTYQTWLLYLTNNITDPYYEWYMDNNQFMEFIRLKYGSFESAEQKVKVYNHDWNNAEDISISYYNSLPAVMKKYWEPSYSIGDKISSYKRKQIDWQVNTNHIVRYQVANTSFVESEICKIVFSNNAIGSGQVTSVTSNSVLIHHVSGNYKTSANVSITPTSYIYGTESFVNTHFSSANVVASSLESEEEIYWKPVSFFEYELNKNEYNKTIRVLDKNFAQVASDNLKNILGE